ncbi:MAG: hypothetical protein OEZ44_07710, partial [Candidatus Bathyarchaeota archaeon]|nr:hypothetical protein [Candidatus Bathyarchaeota archaeon]
MSEELKEALGRIIEAGYQLSADGFEYLGTLEGDAMKDVVRQAIQAAGSSTQDVTILDRGFFQKMQEEALKKARVQDAVTGKPGVRPPASDYDAQIQVLDDGPAEPSGDLEGFVDYFRSRFRSLEGILRQRMDVR